MAEALNSKRYDLEERTFGFARRCRDFVKQLPRTLANIEYGKQLIRSSGSQAANYIEANEAPTKKDFSYKIKMCRKETKESNLWLRLCEAGDRVEVINEQAILEQEAQELRKIFNSIFEKSQ